MNKSTKIIRMDIKRGQNCRTPSTITIALEKSDLANVTAYMDAYESSEAPTGKIKRIELVMYDEADMEEIEKNEALEKQIEELTEKLIIATTDIDISDSDQTMIEDVIIDQDAEGEILEWEEGKVYEQGDKVLYEGVLSQLGEHGFFPLEKEQLPANQRDLKLYEKPCECETSAFVNGKCANCGGVE